MASNLKHDTITVRELIRQYRSGQLMIPEFQRDYVWKPNKAPKLIESLYQDYPISSLLIWESGESDVQSRDHVTSRGETTSWLIDGQQRVTTLARIEDGAENIDVVFDVEHECFQLASATTRKDPNFFRVHDLWDDEEYRRLRRSLKDDRRGARWEERFDRVRDILNYSVPIVRMMDTKFEHAVTAFERINTLGVRLKTEDLESARVAARHSGFIREEVVPSVRKLHQRGLHRLSVMHLFRVCAFLAHPDGRRRTPLHEMERKDVTKAWRQTEKGVDGAIALVQGELGLADMSILWSGALLVPVIALCAKLSPRELNVRELAGWIALAALTHRFSGAAETALEQDIKACRADDPIRALLANLKHGRESLLATAVDFGGTLKDRSGLLATYIACRHRGARDLLSGGQVVMQPSVERHHIIPRARFESHERATADALANIAFISGDTNRSIRDADSERYLAKIEKAILESQCIPLDRALWTVEAAQQFWEQRRSLLATAFNSYVKTMLDKRRIV